MLNWYTRPDVDVWNPLLKSLGLGLSIGLLGACGTKIDNRRSMSTLAEVAIDDIASANWDHLEFQLRATTAGGYDSAKQTLKPGGGSLHLNVPPASYRFILNYFDAAGAKIYGADLCAPEVRNDVQTLVPGLNKISLQICSQSQTPAATTDVPAGVTPTPPPTATTTITPVLHPAGVPGAFSLKGTQLLDASGQPFLIRGVNTPNAYFYDESLAAVSTIKDLGFNTVRIVWCADTLLRPGRCEAKDLHPVADLDRLLETVRGAKMVAVLNLQNATGSDSIDDLQKMADYLTRADVVEVLNRYSGMLLINIANEWLGTWNKASTYVEGYRRVVPRLRQAGLTQPLIVDASGYGQEFASVLKAAADLTAIDPNLLISAHMYDMFSTPASVTQALAAARERKIPLMIGEFACSHGSRGPVACETILDEAAKAEQPLGLIAWSFSGNSPDLSDLNIVDGGDWQSLTPWGSKLLKTANGIAATAKEAAEFTGSH